MIFGMADGAPGDDTNRSANADDRPDPVPRNVVEKEFGSSCGFCHGSDEPEPRSDLIRSPWERTREHGELIDPPGSRRERRIRYAGYA